jgi:hypothetical protein
VWACSPLSSRVAARGWLACPSGIYGLILCEGGDGKIVVYIFGWWQRCWVLVTTWLYVHKTEDGRNVLDVDSVYTRI